MNTCYSPTPNADPHAGSAWIAWLNWREARLSGGDFVVLWDDMTHRNGCCDTTGFSFEHGVERTREQLTWLGMAPDREALWSDHLPEYLEACARLGYRLPRRIGDEPTHHGVVLGMPGTAPGYVALYEPALMCCWVVGDFIEHIDGWFTGKAFESTCLLYEDICQRLGYRPVRRMYVPEVRREDVPHKESKSLHATSIRDMRKAGYEPWQIISTLRESDRLSRLAGLAYTVIPDGMLEAGEVRWLEYQGDLLNAEAIAKGYGHYPCGSDLKARVKRLRRTNPDLQRSLMA